jgi:hypothetical protein
MPIAYRFAKNAYIKNNVMKGIPLVFLTFCVVFLVSCGFDSSKKSSIGGGNSRSATMDTDIDLDELRDLARPPGMDGTVESPNVRTVNGEFREINQKKLLFEERIRDTDDRLDRIENAVQNLSDDFNDVSPAINRLVEIENDLRELYDQLSLLINGSDENFEVVAPPIETAPVVLEEVAAAPHNIKPRASVSNKNNVPVSTSVPNIRAASYPTKTRIVFETADKQKFSSNFDEQNQLLVINSPIRFNQSLLDKVKRSSKHIIDVTATDNGQGADIAIMTKGMSKAEKSAYIGASSSNKNFRYYIDVEK